MDSLSTCMRRSCLILVPALFLSCAGSQANPRVGGPCTYEYFQGIAKFTELKSTPEGIEVHFNFSPSDSTASTRYQLKPGGRDQVLHLVSGGLPTSEWLSSKGISVGVEVPAVYQEERSGTCTPWFYVFPSIPGVNGQ